MSLYEGIFLQSTLENGKKLLNIFNASLNFKIYLIISVQYW